MFERNRIAETLRNARENRGLSVEQVATAAGIPVQYIRLLEGESNVRVGVSDELYLIPFFRKYAGFLAIDAETLLPEFLGVVQHAAATEAAAPVRLAYRSRTARLWGPLAVLVTVIVAAALLLRQTRERSSFEEADSSDANAPVVAVVEPSPVPPPVAATPAEPANAAVGEPSASPPGATSTPTAATTLAANETHELVIVAKEDTWLSVATDDQPSRQYFLHAGASRQWSGRNFSLTVGNAGGVTLSVDGRELPPIGRPGQVVRNLRLPATEPRATSTPGER